MKETHTDRNPDKNVQKWLTDRKTEVIDRQTERQKREKIIDPWSSSNKDWSVYNNLLFVFMFSWISEGGKTFF